MRCDVRCAPHCRVSLHRCLVRTSRLLQLGIIVRSVSFYMLNNLLGNSACQVNGTMVLCEGSPKRGLSLRSVTLLMVLVFRKAPRSCSLPTLTSYLYSVRGAFKPPIFIPYSILNINSEIPDPLSSSTSINHGTCRLGIKPLSWINIVISKNK